MAFILGITNNVVESNLDRVLKIGNMHPCSFFDASSANSFGFDTCLAQFYTCKVHICALVLNYLVNILLRAAN